MKSNRAQIQTGQLFLFIIVGFAFLILIGVFLYSFNIITTSLAGVESAGQVNFSNATANTLGQLNTGLLNNGGLIALFLLFGQVIAMIFVAYLTRESNPSVFFIFEILILIFAYILATYISNTYELVIASVPFESIFTNNLNFATTFMLRLPLIVVVVGVIMMIVAYAGIPKTKEEEVAGF